MHVVIYYTLFSVLVCCLAGCIVSINSLFKRLDYYENLFIDMRRESDDYLQSLTEFSKMDLFSDNEELKMLINRTKSIIEFMDGYEWIEEEEKE
jgi:hypothetical protein